ncbi:pyrimidine/purine nucleoside phosphorylase [Leptospira kirschneri]|uniref:Pyrimidine/purine nucleoside phosphorylase n=2 Tax=Leptospira kirschneri TaxID=29507 RepID=A0A0E2B2Q9_9LEPT|nr:pyrimidine/purine nucleoside phosphorylase [Leptospira kirschneri]EKO15552.1 PF06865 family protein [Leptospira kirschneri str. H1]EMK25040.1 PF06865 family protein [Leptospira kirschneri serovar Bulgarica str. Nikolaevo]UML81868.1 pyrimidine/purine nucleoside phosphorylase [Leptospira kirschneri]
MSQFENVTVLKKANVYYDGKATSRSILFQDGSKKTLGILMPGQYDFGTDEKEIMEILDGELLVKLPGQEVWKEIKGGQSFEVPAKSRFQMDVKKISDYCCSYIQNS